MASGEEAQAAVDKFDSYVSCFGFVQYIFTACVSAWYED